MWSVSFLILYKNSKIEFKGFLEFGQKAVMIFLMLSFKIFFRFIRFMIFAVTIAAALSFRAFITIAFQYYTNTLKKITSQAK